MAKKKKSTAGEADDAPPVQLKEKDKKTLAKLVGLAEQVVKQVDTRKDPHLDIPSRALSNVKFVKTRGILEMGNNTNRRQLFNLSQAKSYMQTMLVGMGCSKLIESGKSSSLRGLYYMLKHSIDNTKEETFSEQSESDVIIEDVEVLVDTLREELHLYAEPKGNIVGSLVLSDMGDEIDCSRMGSSGYSIPSIVEPERIQFLSCEAKFILHVEKGTVWQRFNEDKFWQKNNCLVTHGGGQPSRGVRRMLYRLHHELKLPIYCVLDNDPWGYYIYSVIKQGSINLAFESSRMAIPEAKFVGLRSFDLERCELSPSVKIKLNDNDKKRAKQILKYPWFAGKPKWKKEIDKMLTNDFKLEVESLISKDISYVTETYVPERLQEQDWLD